MRALNKPTPVSGDDPIGIVADKPGKDGSDAGQPPESTEVRCDSQYGRRAHRHVLGCASPGPFYPDHGLGVHQFRVALTKALTKGALNRSEVEYSFAVVSQDELHALHTEATCPIVD